MLYPVAPPRGCDSSNIGADRALFLRVRKGTEGALINIHTNEGA